jgi:hypothetical protein
MQEAARQEGWSAPWDREDQRKQKKTAGDKSGAMRAGRAEVRRHFVKTAFERLNTPFQTQPFSEHSIDALQVEYERLLAEGGNDAKELMSAAPFKADRETLRKDLKALGIRSRRRKNVLGNEHRSRPPRPSVSHRNFTPRASEKWLKPSASRSAG